MNIFTKILQKGFVGALFSLGLVASANAVPAGSPVALNGKLHISGTKMVNECGNTVQLRGMSTHGPQWFGKCYCKESLQTMVDDWGISVFRYAMYVREDGYVTNPNYYREQIDMYADYCEEMGIYFLIDWHVLNPGNPNDNLNDAISFWDYMSKKHGSKKHIIYEICNEPNGGVSWGQVKSYAEKIISTIRANDKNTIIIVGTPTWSQDVDAASNDKLTDENVMYTLHFYSGSHGNELRSKAETALSRGCAIFVTECGTCDASGNGNYSPESMKTWVNWMNQKDISWINWSFADKGETASALVPGACESKSWNNTTASGTLVKDLIKADPFKFTACGEQQQGGQQQGGDQGGQQQGGQQGGDQGGQQQGGDQGGQQGGQQQGGDQGGQQGGQQQPNVTYPTLETGVAKLKVYRIVNKKSGMVMSMKGSEQDKAQVVQAARSDNDDSQLFELREFDGFFTLTNVKSGKVLTNSYNPNPGAQIVQQELSAYDNPSEKFKFTLVNDKWFRIDNKSGNDRCLAVENGSYNEGTGIVQADFSNADEQLWGLEYVGEVDTSAVAVIYNEALALAPALVTDAFSVYGDYQSLEVFDVTGVKVMKSGYQSSYDISNLPTGAYVVVVDSNGQLVHFKIVKK